MNKFKFGVVILALSMLNNAFAVISTTKGTDVLAQFANQYRGETYTPNNEISPQWIRSALEFMRRAGLDSDLSDQTAFNSMANVLWEQLEYTVNYYAAQPAFRSDANFKNRVWTSLVRGLRDLVNKNYPSQLIQGKYFIGVQQPQYTAPQQQRVQPQVKQALQEYYTVQTILSGILGGDYALKVKEIQGYDYTKNRDINLVDKLNRAITMANSSALSDREAASVLKYAIDGAWNDLVRYRVRDAAMRQPAVQQQAQAVRPLPQVPQARREAFNQQNINKFIADSKRPNMALADITNRQWLTAAVGVILNGNVLTDENKSRVMENLFEIVNQVYMDALRVNPSTTDAYWNRANTMVESQVKSFMDNGVRVGASYG